MCFKTPKVPPPPAVAAAPTRATVDTGEARKKVAARNGVFGNILTSPLGDSGYGQSVKKLATLGGSTA